MIVLPESLRLQGAIRLLPERAGDPTLAGQRFLDSARMLNINLDLMFGTVTGGATPGSSQTVHQACLAVPGTGRTTMLFVSSDDAKPKAWAARKLRAGGEAQQGHIDRVALIRFACDFVGAIGPSMPRPSTLVQVLLEPKETDVGRALNDAGFMSLGELAYLRRSLPGVGNRPGKGDPLAGQSVTWPAGIWVRPFIEYLSDPGATPASADAVLATALERSYADTQDCPELCGLRDIADVIESHRSVGEYDPSLWWIVENDQGPQGCLLLSAIAESDSVELVYIGLSPQVRGKGLANTLMTHGISTLYREGVVASQAGRDGPFVRGTGGLTCAVDLRNAPALALYQRLGFARTSLRLPWVRSVKPPIGR